MRVSCINPAPSPHEAKVGIAGASEAAQHALVCFLYRKVLERSRKAQNLFLKFFAPGVEKRPATAPDGHQSTMGTLWVDRWLSESTESFCIDDPRCCAAQVCT